MIKSLCNTVFDRHGWTIGARPDQPVKRCVIIAAPHTSNWDFVYAMSVIDRLNLPNPRFTIKKEWMRFPFAGIMDRLGAIPIDRSRTTQSGERMSMVEQMTEYLRNASEMTLIVTPEGTRSAVKQWKTGFYHVALNAGVPILLGYMDYAKKEAGVGQLFEPTGDYDKDMRSIWSFYNTITPRFPEKYTRMPTD
ncbi:MAG: 1-acyl-sn-glycerol-3-phosphate acyltransferase [Gammaproteobacteria bacterium]|nr:1-acyl-sn-glycerol-3-phosphate acyltransferase [Gammaproteobacteria bacterium]